MVYNQRVLDFSSFYASVSFSYAYSIYVHQSFAGPAAPPKASTSVLPFMMPVVAIRNLRPIKRGKVSVTINGTLFEQMKTTKASTEE